MNKVLYKNTIVSAIIIIIFLVNITEKIYDRYRCNSINTLLGYNVTEETLPVGSIV
jgi:hypothetical protein